MLQEKETLIFNTVEQKVLKSNSQNHLSIRFKISRMRGMNLIRKISVLVIVKKAEPESLKFM